jgi:hypothetical protein
MRGLKTGAIAVAAFIFFHVALHGFLNISKSTSLWGALPPAALVVFLWTPPCHTPLSKQFVSKVPDDRLLTRAAQQDEARSRAATVRERFSTRC